MPRMSKRVEILDLKGEDFASIAREVLGRRGRAFRFRAKGGSMSPFIRDGDVVEVVPLKGKMHPGDIVFCCPSYGKPVVHRVLQRTKKIIITKGDSLYRSDQPVLPKHVLGEVVSVEKNGWRIRLDTPMVRLINILLATISPFSLLIYPSLKFMKPIGVVLAPALHRLSRL